MKKILLVPVLTCIILHPFLNAQNVGVGNASPQSKLHVNGTSWFTGDNTPLPASAGQGIAIGHTGGNGYLYSFDYGSFTPKSLVLQGPGGNVGIGTLTPQTKLTVNSTLFGIEHTNGTVSLSTYLSSGAGWIGTRSNHPLYFYTNNSSQLMTLNQAGQLGIGTSTPLGGYKLDVAGLVNSSSDYTHYVAHATGGTNAWARYYMNTNAQSWFIGTSQNYNGNQFYLGDQTYNITRFSIQPNGGPIYMTGNITQDAGGYGLPKAMIEVGPSGNIIRCYNGVTGTSTIALSGFSVVYTPGTFATPHQYRINFGFYVKNRFFSVTPKYQANPRYATVSNNEDAETSYLTDNEILVINWQGGSSLASTFYVVVY